MDDLNRWARDELRSLNAQIEFLLRDAVRRRTRKESTPSEDRPANPATDQPS